MTTTVSSVTDGEISGFWLNSLPGSLLKFDKWELADEVRLWRRTIIADVSAWVTQAGKVFSIDPQVHDILVRSVNDESNTMSRIRPQRLSFGAQSQSESDSRIQVLCRDNIQKNLQLAAGWKALVSISLITQF